MPKFDFQSQCFMSKIIVIFLIFFHWKIWIKVQIFSNWHFLITLIFKLFYFLKILTACHFIWFLAQNLSNFVFLPWKHHNLYCHTIHLPLPLEERPLSVHFDVISSKKLWNCSSNFFFLNKENVKNDAITTVYMAQWVELSNIHILHNSSFLKDLWNEEIMLVWIENKGKEGKHREFYDMKATSERILD